MRSVSLLPLLGLWSIYLQALSKGRAFALENDDDDDDDEEVECVDFDTKRCSYWASIGECQENPRFMLDACRFSCNVCGEDDDEGDGSKEQVEDQASLWRRGVDLGEPQILQYTDGTHAGDILWLITKARSYMKHWVSDYIGDGMDKICRNQHEDCAYWALQGECEANDDYMKIECAPVCGSCFNLTVEARCPLDPNAPNVWKPGDLTALFERLTSEPYLTKYDVQILASPRIDEEDPWVITMENIISEVEAKHLIEWGSKMGYRRSTDVGKRQVDGRYGKKISSGRTSMNAWCINMCEEDETVMDINERISKLIGIPDTNAERLQLLRYEPGQYYTTHHDMIQYQADQQGGHRILTVYIYLNDVEEGGGTMFDELDELTVMPKRGRILIWPSVHDEDPFEKDWRTSHQALEVIRGIKYGANAWYHMRDYKTASDSGCM